MSTSTTKPLTGFLDVNGGKLYYEVAGEGHPIVFIHAGVADNRMWDDQFGLFAEQYQVIRYDTRGFGKTTTESVEFSNRQDLYDLLKHLNVDRAALIGVSRGGQIATDFTLEHPEMVDALVLGGAGLGGYQHQPAEADALETQTFTEMDELWGKGEFDRLAEMEVQMFVDGPGQPSDRVDSQMRQRMQKMNYGNFNRNEPEPKPQPLDPPAVGRLSEINVPTLIIVGDLDTSGTLVMADQLAQGIKGARKVIRYGVAHMVNMERPDEYNKMVLDFLKENI